MNDLAARLYKLPSAQPALRFDKYAETYARDTIAHHRGARRELELLKPLRAFFDRDLLTAIDQDRVRRYMTHRADRVSARTVNREVDLLKAMLRDAAPKYLTASPLVGMKRLRIVQPKRRLMSASEERKLLRVGDAVDRALLILGVDGLIRLGDLLDLHVRDRRGRWLYIADPKSGEPYEVFLTTRAAKALDKIHTEQLLLCEIPQGREPARLGRRRPATARNAVPRRGPEVRAEARRPHVPLGDAPDRRDTARRGSPRLDSCRAAPRQLEDRRYAARHLHGSRPPGPATGAHIPAPFPAEAKVRMISNDSARAMGVRNAEVRSSILLSSTTSSLCNSSDARTAAPLPLSGFRHLSPTRIPAPFPVTTCLSYTAARPPRGGLYFAHTSALWKGSV
jgi:hypothetical protein